MSDAKIRWFWTTGWHRGASTRAITVLVPHVIGDRNSVYVIIFFRAPKGRYSAFEGFGERRSRMGEIWADFAVRRWAGALP